MTFSPEMVVTAVIQGVGLIFVAGVVYKGHTRMETDMEKKADKDDVEGLKDDQIALSMEVRGLDRRVTRIEPRGAARARD